MLSRSSSYGTGNIRMCRISRKRGRGSDPGKGQVKAKKSSFIWIMLFWHLEIWKVVRTDARAM